METRQSVIAEICNKIGQCSTMIAEYECSIRSLQDGGEDEVAEQFEDMEVSVLGQLQSLTILLTGVIDKRNTPLGESEQSDYVPTEEYEEELGEVGT